MLVAKVKDIKTKRNKGKLLCYLELKMYDKTYILGALKQSIGIIHHRSRTVDVSQKHY